MFSVDAHILSSHHNQNPTVTSLLSPIQLAPLFSTQRSLLPPMAIPPKLTSFSSSSSTMAAARSLEEGLASRYWLKFRRETIFVMYTPFVVSLAAGNLKIESFRHFLAQDSYFLKAFAHAWVLLVYFSVHLFDLDFVRHSLVVSIVQEKSSLNSCK